MIKLPTEILNLIFIHLPLIQKQECMLVSKQWKELIQASSLYNSIHISSPDVFKKFIDFIEQQPELGRQVESLVLIGCIDFTFNREKLILLFPNAKNITISRASRTPNAIPIKNQPSLLTSSVNGQIQKLQEFNESEFELTRLLMTHNSCHNLRTLKLIRQPINTTDILPSLKNMPVLESLILHDFTLSMDICETMHKNLPSLKSFVVTNADLLSTRLPNHIAPNTSLTTLEISRYLYPNNPYSVNWLKYFARKYSHLKRFKFNLYHVFELGDWGMDYQVQMSLLFQNCGSNLTSFYLNCLLDPDLKVLKEIDNLGYHLRELEIDRFNDIDGYTVLAGSNQSKYIERLDLVKVHPQYNLGKLKGMERLKSLKLQFIGPRETYTDNILDAAAYKLHVQENTIDIVELFSYFPESLESVDIIGVDLAFNIDTTGEIHTSFHQIKTLKLNNINIEKANIDKFISACLPNLTSLNLASTFSKLKGTFSIPHHHLSSLDIYLGPYLIQDPFQNVCVIQKNKQPRYFTKNKRQPKGYSKLGNCLLPVTLDDLHIKRFLTIVCASLDNLVFLEKDVFFSSSCIY